jgi:hypothetical protein
MVEEKSRRSEGIGEDVDIIWSEFRTLGKPRWMLACRRRSKDLGVPGFLSVASLSGLLIALPFD